MKTILALLLLSATVHAEDLTRVELGKMRSTEGYKNRAVFVSASEEDEETVVADLICAAHLENGDEGSLNLRGESYTLTDCHKKLANLVDQIKDDQSVFATLDRETKKVSHFDLGEAALDNTLVKNTFKLMQSKHAGQCIEPTSKNIVQRSMGAIPSATELRIYTGAYSISVRIKCPTETAVLYGVNRMIFVLDSKGIRNDIKPVDLGLTFNDLEFEK